LRNASTEPAQSAGTPGIAKAPALRELTASRRAATLLATVRQLGTASVDDALDLCDVLMATRLLAQATRRGNDERLRSLPRLRRAAATIAAAARDQAPAPDAEQRAAVVLAVADEKRLELVAGVPVGDELATQRRVAGNALPSRRSGSLS